MQSSRSNRRPLRNSLAGLLAAAIALCATVASARAQATTTAAKQLDLSAFGGYVSSNPDYGPYRDTGFGFGVNVTRHFHFPISPSLEFRTQYVHGDTVNEHMYLFGLRGQADFLHHRVHPYANILFGPGTINYVNFEPYPNYTHDNGLVTSIGFGADFDVWRNFQLKGDFQAQPWNLGNNFTLSPSTVLIGVSYRIPFRPHLWQATNR